MAKYNEWHDVTKTVIGPNYIITQRMETFEDGNVKCIYRDIIQEIKPGGFHGTTTNIFYNVIRSEETKRD